MPRTVDSPLVRTEPRLRAAYSEGAGIYRILPAGVALPGSVADLQALVGWARKTGTPLVPRGAGSGIPGNAVGPGVIVDLRERMPRVLEVDKASATGVTSANVTLADLNRTAGAVGLRLPPDPASAAWATLGGMVGTNAAGARSVRYGPVRPWVIGIEIVTGDGEVCWLSRRAATGPLVGQADRAAILPTAITRLHGEAAPLVHSQARLVQERFPRVRKNTAGYALDHWLRTGDDLDLVIGAEGTLALVTAIRWQLDPIPPARSGLRVALRSLDDLEEAVKVTVALEPSAVELLDRTFLDLLAPAGRSGERPDLPAGSEAVLLVEFERSKAAQARLAAVDAARALKPLATDILAALTGDEEQRLWRLRHAASPILAGLPPERRSLQVIEDGCVPLPRLGEYVRVIRRTADLLGITVVVFGHAGDGNIHVNAIPRLAEPDWGERIQRLYTEVNAAAIRLGGTVSGEHGDGRLRAPLLEALYGAEIVELFRSIKTAFDPGGIFNPGVKLAPDAPALARLKVGPEAVVIPDDVAAALREIERTGGYARSRLEIAEEQDVQGPGLLHPEPGFVNPER